MFPFIYIKDAAVKQSQTVMFTYVVAKYLHPIMKRLDGAYDIIIVKHI